MVTRDLPRNFDGAKLLARYPALKPRDFSARRGKLYCPDVVTQADVDASVSDPIDQSARDARRDQAVTWARNRLTIGRIKALQQGSEMEKNLAAVCIIAMNMDDIMRKRLEKDA